MRNIDRKTLQGLGIIAVVMGLAIALPTIFPVKPEPPAAKPKTPPGGHYVKMQNCPDVGLIPITPHDLALWGWDILVKCVNVDVWQKY